MSEKMPLNSFISNLNQEKQEIITTDGNVLVIANPGTGKTLLLAYKYIYLLKKGFSAKDILCLTFTNKAKKELEERIIKIIKENKIEINFADLQVHTFHSYALEFIGEAELVSTNLLRYSIFKFMKENEILNYPDTYLLDKIIPKMETHISYLKSYGFAPDNIVLEDVSKIILDDDFLVDEKQTKQELINFAEHFINIYKHYESQKENKIDYADMLIDFLNQTENKIFKYVLVDELQDVNMMESEIAIKSAENFVAVGDKKQAIFGFQGGSILNFEKFKNSKQFILSENFRSSNEILKYASESFISQTKDKNHQSELKELKNLKAEKSIYPTVIEVCKNETTKKDETYLTICELAKTLLIENNTVAIIARTNNQITKISKELNAFGLEYSSTFYGSSNEAKDKILIFLKGIVSDELQLVKNSLFSLYSPISIQRAFEISKMKIKSLDELLIQCNEIKLLRDKTKTTEDIDIFFKERIIPISITYGKEFYLAALSLQNSFAEAIKVLKVINFENIFQYLSSSPLLTDNTDIEKKLVLTSVHKAKGKEYDNVIYVPTKPKDSTNFQDKIVEAILLSKNINAREELEEETLRIDFVAFTRAKNKLYILTEKLENYLNDFSQLETIEISSIESYNIFEKNLKAFNLFINKDFDNASKLLEIDKSWLIKFVNNYFTALEHLSFTKLEQDPFTYLKDNILKIKDTSPSMELGSQVHLVAENLCKQIEIEIQDEVKPFAKNIESILIQIKKLYPEFVEAESNIKLPLSKLFYTTDEILFTAKIDAIFKNGDKYLIVDWKTDKKNNKASEHRRQLEVYKKVYSIQKDIPLDKIKTAICFIGLRETINDGKINYEFDQTEPKKNIFDTFIKHATTILNWRADEKLFFKQLIAKPEDDFLYRSVVEQYKIEMK